MGKIIMYVMGMLFMLMNVISWATRYGYIQSVVPLAACTAAFLAVFASWLYAAKRTKTIAKKKEVM